MTYIERGFFSLADAYGQLCRVDLSVSCNEALRLLRAEATTPIPLRANHAMGSRKPDWYVATTCACPVILHRTLFDTWQVAGITGWSQYPMEIAFPDGRVTNEYRGLVVTGRVRRIGDDASRIVEKRFHASIPTQVRVGIGFDDSEWDGTDVVMPEENYQGVVMLSSAAVAVLDGFRPRHWALTEIHDLEVCDSSD